MFFSSFFIYLFKGFEGAPEKKEGDKETLLYFFFDILYGIKPHSEWECCHAWNGGRSRKTKGQIHQTQGAARQGGERWVLIKAEAAELISQSTYLVMKKKTDKIQE